MDLERFELMATAADGTTDLCRLEGCTLDMAVSDDPDDNDFTLSCPVSGFVPEDGAVIYVEGTEIGGVVEGRGTDSQAATVELVGRTWSGLLDARVIRPPAGANYYTYSGDIRSVMRGVITATDLTGFFTVAAGACGKTISGSFDRYCSVWEGLRKELKRAGWRPSATWDGDHWVLDAVEAKTVEVSAQDARVTSDAGLAPYNHLICAGEGELKDRIIVDLYADAEGQVSQTKTLTGKAERAALYDRTSSDREELVKDGTEKLQELQATPTLAVDLTGLSIDAAVGDSICVIDDDGGTEVTAEVTRTVAKVADNALKVTLEGGNTRQTRSLTGSSETGGGGGSITGIVQIAQGGTGADNRKDAMANLAYLGQDITGGSTNDTGAFWLAKGAGYAWFNSTGQLNGQPEQYGFLLSMINNSNVSQIFIAQNNSNVYRRGNTSNGTMPGFTKIYDYANRQQARSDMGLGNTLGALPVANGGTGQTRLTGNPGLIHSMFDTAITSGTLYFPVFTGSWADGGYMDNSQLKSYLGIADSGWQSISVSGGSTPIKYRKIGKMVFMNLRFVPAGTSDWKLLCTLPAGYRPPDEIVGAIMYQGPGGYNGGVKIQTNGQVATYGNNASAFWSGTITFFVN